MTPKEYAQNLYDEFYELGHLIETNYAKEHCKKCALIVIDKIRMELVHVGVNFNNQFADGEISLKELHDFYLKVKEEIQKL